LTIPLKDVFGKIDLTGAGGIEFYVSEPTSGDAREDYFIIGGIGLKK
jgi:hypothetical protein